MTRVRSRVIGLLPILALVAVPPLKASAQKIPLRWKYEPGTELVYRMTNNQQMDMGAMGGSTLSEQIQTMRWRVVEVAPDGDATVTVKTERVQVDVQNPMMSMKFDSEDDSIPDNPQARMFGAMAGMSYTIVVSPTGAVQSVQGLEELKEQVLEAMSTQGAPMLGDMFDQMFSEETLSRMMQQSIQLFPDEPVGPGDTWQSSFSMPVPMAGEATMSMEFTVTDIIERDGRAVAQIATDGELSITASPDSQLPATIDFGSTTMTGGIEFDVDRGITSSSDMRMTMQMTVAAGAQEMSFSMAQHTKLELVEYIRGR